MAKLEAPKRIRTEDFSSDFQELIGKLGFSINDFQQQVYNAFNGAIDFSNLNQEVSTVTVNIDSSGELKTNPKIKSNLNSKVQGITVIRAENKDNPSSYPVSCPFLSWTLSGNIITIKNVTGLWDSDDPEEVNYKLTCLLIGR